MTKGSPMIKRNSVADCLKWVGILTLATCLFGSELPAAPDKMSVTKKPAAKSSSATLVKAPVSKVGNLELIYADGGVRVRVHTGSRIEFSHQIEPAKNGRPYRIILDCLNSNHNLGGHQFRSLPASVVKRIRTSQFAVKPQPITRIVLDLSKEAFYRVEQQDEYIDLFVTDRKAKRFNSWSSLGWLASRTEKKAQSAMAAKAPATKPLASKSAAKKSIPAKPKSKVAPAKVAVSTIASNAVAPKPTAAKSAKIVSHAKADKKSADAKAVKKAPSKSSKVVASGHVDSKTLLSSAKPAKVSKHESMKKSKTSAVKSQKLATENATAKAKASAKASAQPKAVVAKVEAKSKIKRGNGKSMVAKTTAAKEVSSKAVSSKEVFSKAVSSKKAPANKVSAKKSPSSLVVSKPAAVKTPALKSVAQKKPVTVAVKSPAPAKQKSVAGKSVAKKVEKKAEPKPAKAQKSDGAVTLAKSTLKKPTAVKKVKQAAKSSKSASAKSAQLASKAQTPKAKAKAPKAKAKSLKKKSAVAPVIAAKKKAPAKSVAKKEAAKPGAAKKKAADKSSSLFATVANAAPANQSASKKAEQDRRYKAQYRRSIDQRKIKLKGAQVAEFPKRLTIKYKTHGTRDPFGTLLEESSVGRDGMMNEKPNVEALTMVGILRDVNGKTRGLFEDIDGRGYILSKGDKVRNGTVLKVTKHKAYFQIFEYGWSRTVALSLEG
jgi:hypothetical protein